MLFELRSFKRFKHLLTAKRCLLGLLLAGAVAAVSGCHTVGFYGQALKGQYQIFAHEEKIEKLLADPATTNALRQRLVVLEDLRAFARKDLKLPVDSVTARACAPLARLLGYARPYLAKGATGWFLKGQDVAAELEEATKSWDFEVETVPSLSDPRGRIVRVRRLRRARKA